jgi:hypothetical protein
MAVLNRRLGFGVVVIAAAFLLCGAASARADAADCVAFGGTFVPGTPDECQISGALVKTGTFNLDETLHLLNGGSITVASPSLTLNITGGFIMDAGSLIDGGNNTCSGPNQSAFPITVNATGDIDVKGPGAGGTPPGAIIRSNGCSGGAIELNAGGSANIDGTVESVGARTGTGANQGPGGGPITIHAVCELTVSDTGLVSSRGKDPGADLVHLDACTVFVYGKVESTGPGHAVPNNPPNHCDNNAGAGGGLRPDKPANSTACVEIWGNTITIDSTGTHHGEVNADIGQSGDATGRSWIDIYATTKVTITDGTGNNYLVPIPGSPSFNQTFAVHANQFRSNGVSSIAGIITIKSMEGNAEGTGDVAQADDTGGLAKGGTITFEAFSNLNLNGGTIFARGDFAEGGGYGVGGKVFTRSYHGTLSWANGVVDARPIGTDTVPPTLAPANRGEIRLQDCLAPAGVDTSTLVVPSNNNPANSSVAGFNVDPDNCVGVISKPSYVILPPATCVNDCAPPAIKRGIKYNDLNKNGTRDGSPLEPVLSNWEIHLFGQPDAGAPIHLHQLTDGSGKYEFIIPPGTYTVCETLQPGWTQSQPASGADCSAHGGGFGYDITLVAGQVDEDNDFGNWKETTVVCPEDPKAVLTRTVAPAPLGGLPNHTSLQAAYDAAANGEVIGIFGKFTENVVLGDHDLIEGDKTLKITQCTSAQFTAADNAKPVFDVTSTGNLTIVSPDSVNGSIGWRVASDGHHLKSIRANDSFGPGVLVVGNSNEVSWNEIAGNTVGMQVEGDGNDLRGGTIQENTGDGVWLTATADSNKLQGATIQLNGGNGVRVDGTLNLIKSNGRLNQNTLSGLAGAGSDNTIQSNAADDNSGSGFSISGPGNLFQDNKASKNTLFGFDIAAGTSSKPNRLRSNASNNGSSGGSSENDSFEFNLLDYVKNESGGNKADGVGIPKTTVPTKCSQFPATNATKNFAAAYACGDGAD